MHFILKELGMINSNKPR